MGMKFGYVKLLTLNWQSCLVCCSTVMPLCIAYSDGICGSLLPYKEKKIYLQLEYSGVSTYIDQLQMAKFNFTSCYRVITTLVAL